MVADPEFIAAPCLGAAMGMAEGRIGVRGRTDVKSNIS